MKRLSYILGLGLLLVVNSVFAQESITIAKAREMALEYNKTLKVADLQRMEAGANQKQARTAYLPMIDASGTAMFLPQLDNVEIPGFHLPTADNSGNITGMSDVYFPGVNIETERLQLYQAQLDMQIPIYAGGRIRYANKMADKGVEIAEEAYQLETEQVVLNTDKVYWQLVALKENLKVANKYVTMLDSLESQLKVMYDIGLVPKSEQLKVSVQKNEAELNLMRAANAYQLVQMNLCQTIGLPLNSAVEVDDDLNENPEMLSLADALNKAMDSRSELHILGKQVEINDYRKKSVSAEYRPSLGAQVSYGYTHVPNLITDQFMTTASAQLSIPIVHWGEKKHKMDAARYQVQQSQLKLDETREFVQMEVQQYMLQLSEAYESIFLAKKGKLEAEENLEEVKLSYEAGLNTTTDLLNAQASWQKAQAGLLEALANYEIAKTTYYKGIGQLAIN
ncbi:TolC family protein [Carboxylicivirga sp. N1Y90]|uniref:TolC family protein n=1 Tax=Carboxylicivirga fragile TaxID=3417571 RepID=UPI003D3429E2|nr:TolC family protein [Marinilabiliaceae bacterium N1Y90]